MFKGYTKHKYCEFIGWDCYCDGSCLAAKEYLQILFEKGSDEVFKKLEEDYETEFGRKTKSKRKKMLKNNIVWVGLMRLITFNYKKFCKPTSEGWRRN